MTPRELRKLCPPLADFQAVSLRDRDEMRRLVIKVARLIGLDATEALELRNRFETEYKDLQEAIRDSVDSCRMLPDRFAGMVAYNHSIPSSQNFRMPEIFTQYQSELLLMGVNLSFLLNLGSGRDNLHNMLDSLLPDRRRRVRILIADLWDPEIAAAYNEISFGAGSGEILGLDSTFFDPTSVDYFDRAVREHCGPAGYSRARRQLTIKKMPILMDTFWFVDPDGPELEAEMLFALMTTFAGRERPVFYVNRGRHPEPYARYFDLCMAAYDNSTDVLWPRP